MEQTLKQHNDLQIKLTGNPTPTDRSYLHRQIKAFNNAVSPHHRAARKAGEVLPLGVFIRTADRQLVGGLVGDTYWGWLEINDFWIDESLRGQGFGRELLLAAETEAIMRGCTRVFLQTYSFQARGFYEKLGYGVVGQLDDYPPGQSFCWMRKELGRPATHVSFKSVRTDDDTLAYLAQINRNHPARPAVVSHIESQIAALPFDSLQVVELCFGPGMLARHLLGRLPNINYTGLDLGSAFTAFAQKQLAPFTKRTTLHKTDLNRDDWPKLLPANIHAIVSLQSLHDLGGEAEVSRIYRLVKELLAPSGLFLNADLIVEEGKHVPNNPGRLTVSRHLELLRGYGFENSNCTLEVEDFGCVQGWNQ